MLYGERVLTESNVYLHLAGIKNTEVHESSKNNDNGIGSARSWRACVIPPGISLSVSPVPHSHTCDANEIDTHTHMYTYIQ